MGVRQRRQRVRIETVEAKTVTASPNAKLTPTNRQRLFEPTDQERGLTRGSNQRWKQAEHFIRMHQVPSIDAGGLRPAIVNVSLAPDRPSSPHRCLPGAQ